MTPRGAQCDLDIHEMICAYTPSPVLVIIDVQVRAAHAAAGDVVQWPHALGVSQPQELGLPTSAYTVVGEVSSVCARMRARAPASVAG